MTVKDQKIFINYFPCPPEPNPFMFISKEQYFKARNALHELGYARDEWENWIADKITILEDDISCWKNLYDNYSFLLNKGLREEYR